MTNGNDKAFARPGSIDETNGTLSEGNRQIDEQAGLSKREYFAALAMQGLISNPAFDAVTMQAAMQEAVKNADALIEALNAKEYILCGLQFLSKK